VFFCGSLILSLGEGIKILKLISESVNRGKPYLPKLTHCFEKNSISSGDFSQKNLSDARQFSFNEINNLHSGFIAIQVYKFCDLFEQSEFLTEMQKYLKYIE